LATIVATIIGIFLLLIYTININTVGITLQKSTTFSQIEILPKENTNIASLLNNAKEELDIVCSPFTYLVNQHIENTISFKDLFNIDKVKILIQNPSYIFYAYEMQKSSNSAAAMNSKANNNNSIYRYMQYI
jgi:hypothetical protein